jgi:hypothetical protein
MRKSKVLAKLRQGKPALLAFMGYFVPPFVAYAAHTGYDAMLIVQIAAVPGIDGLYIGPGDLGLRMTHELEASRLRIEQTMERVGAACAAHGKSWGSYSVAEESVEAQTRLGANLLVWGTDFQLLRWGIERSRETLRRITDQHTG